MGKQLVTDNVEGEVFKVPNLPLKASNKIPTDLLLPSAGPSSYLKKPDCLMESLQSAGDASWANQSSFAWDKVLQNNQSEAGIIVNDADFKMMNNNTEDSFQTGQVRLV